MFDVASLTFKVLTAGSRAFTESETAKKVRSFSDLPPGWHYGRGVPASTSRVGRALAYLIFLSELGLNETGAFPGVDGEVMLTAYKGDHYVQLTIESDDSATLVHQIRDEDIRYDEGLYGQRLITALEEVVADIEQRECDTSALYIQNTLIGRQAGSKTSSSRTIPMEAASRSFTRNAPNPQAERYVSTFMPIIPTLPPSHPFFGSLMNPYYRVGGV